ncbi:hypothetical protein B4135_1958 [Caldibacillus debilis]|uniref:Uncharacterized protein n=1 Tax=Caldibacillus debilis TaxID=301148 RepID=A0A150M7K1_9BACI|nr:hypothetical protein B4135_1958 [Caldibacillus debilis]
MEQRSGKNHLSFHSPCRSRRASGLLRRLRAITGENPPGRPAKK